MEARGSSPKPPQAGAAGSPSPTSAAGGVGGSLLGHNVDKAPGRGLLRSAGGQVSPSTPPQGTHLPKPAGWEWKVGRANTKVTARNKSSQALQQVQRWQGWFSQRKGNFQLLSITSPEEICQCHGAAFLGAIVWVETQSQREVIPPPMSPPSQVLIQG